MKSTKKRLIFLNWRNTRSIAVLVNLQRKLRIYVIMDFTYILLHKFIWTRCHHLVI
jgi:hypothetical protein